VINNDTVVVLPIQEAKNINTTFLKLKDSIALYKLDNERIIDDFTDYQININRKMNNYRVEKDSVYTLYLSNKKIYEHREREFRKERISQQFLTMIVMMITVILAIK